MAVSSDLFELILSLSKSEKRYFKLYCSQQSKSPKKYLLLFDAIASQNEYDQEKLKRRLKKPELIKNLSYDKNYLSKLILKCMRAYHSMSTVDIRLAEMLQDILFLHRKGLYNQSATLIAKAKYLAGQYEKFHFSLLFLDLQRKVIKKEWQLEMGEGIRKAIAEKDALFEVIEDHYRLVDIYDQVFVVSRAQSLLRLPEALGMLEKLIAKAGAQPEENPSFLGGLFGLVSMAVYHQLKGDFPSALGYHRQVVQRWESRTEMIEEYPHSFRIALSNYLTLCYAAKEWTDFPAKLAKLNELPARNFDEEAEAFQNEFYLRILYYSNTGQFAKADALIPKVERGLRRYAPKINKARALSICYSIILNALIQGAFSKALAWIRRVRDEVKTEQRKDIQEFVLLLELILHFELGQLDLVEYQIRSVRSRLQKHRLLDGFEQAMFKGFRSILKAGPDADITVIYSTWHAAITEANDCLGKEITLLWLVAKSKGKSLESVVLEGIENEEGFETS